MSSRTSKRPSSLGPLDRGTIALGLVGVLASTAPPRASAAELDPAIYVLVDTSGSMLMTPDGTQNTYGDGSGEHPHVSGFTSRFYMAKEAMRTVIDAYGEVRWGLARFKQSSARNYLCSCSSEIPNNLTGCGGYGGLWHTQDDCRLCDLMSPYPDHDQPGTHDRVCINYAGGVLAGCTDPISELPLIGADILVPLGSGNQTSILKWINHQETDPGETGYNAALTPELQPDPELRASGGTPIGGSLLDLYTRLSNTDIGADPLRGCRPYSIIVLTDGAESCNSNPVTRATQLRQTPDLTRNCGTGCPPNSSCVSNRCVYDVKTYVIAFAVAPNEFINCNDIAVAGGTGAAIPASNSADLVAAMAEIIADSIRTERCNGVDDDCDGAIDEDFTDLGQACNNSGLGQCYCAGVKQCAPSGLGTECAFFPANAGNPCGQVGYGPEASFGCDGLDNNCNGLVDEGLTCTPPPPDLCNGVDDDGDPGTPDGADDPAVGQPCGSAIGICEPGTTVCLGGTIVCQGGVPPSSEECNGYDDNCDGVVDGMTRSCYSYAQGCVWNAGTLSWDCEGQCNAGLQICPALSSPNPANTWGACLGETGSSAEVCDGLDNDCDGDVDENLTQYCYPPGSGPTTGCLLSGGVWICLGLCQAGTRDCLNGAWTQCAGHVTPTMEICDNLDNDCNGLVDDDIPGLGQPCSNALGRCTPGTLQCVNGQEVCEGGDGPFPGECNGLDDDCDGAIDETDEVSHLEGLPCGDATGVCTEGQTVCLGGQIACVGGTRPSMEVCDGLDNDCDGIIDEEADCGPGWWCVAAACRQECDLTAEFPCPGGLLCTPYDVDGVTRNLCLPPTGLCGTETCPEGWICVDEECLDPCAQVSCNPWEACRAGLCMDVSCTGIGGGCPTGFQCNAATHACEPDPCSACAAGEACVNARCVSDPCPQAGCDPVWEYCVRACTGADCTATCEEICLCGDGQVCDQGGHCVLDPCGAPCGVGLVCQVGDCVLDPCYGVGCAPGEACFLGDCLEDPCDELACPDHTLCVIHATGDGTEVVGRCDPRPGRWIPEDGGGFITTGGGGGCQSTGHSGGFLLLLGALVGLALLRTRTTRRRRGLAAGRLLVLVTALALAGGLGACDITPFPLGGGGHWQYLDASADRQVITDATTDASADACVPAAEICDGLDNDCDGVVDNGFNFAADPNNCGACDVVCQFLNAVGDCVDTDLDGLGSCLMVGCRPGFHDLNDDPSDGCEYSCQQTGGGTEICDSLDNDCNGVPDDGFDLQTDPLNCGACGFPCVFFNGQGSCVGGQCALSDCNPGYVDKDLNPNNGCECMITNPTDTCDGVDSDCDGLIDEDAPVGDACYTHPTGCTETSPGSGVYNCVGQCHTGNMGCSGGITQCTNQQGPEGEICNGLDDDCNGVVDDGYNLQTDPLNCGLCGRSCFASAPANAYTTGCVTGSCYFECLPGHHDLNGDRNTSGGNGCEYACEATAPAGTEFCDNLDNDCDGSVDEASDLVAPPASLCKQQAGSPCWNIAALCSTGVLGKTWYCQYPAGVERDPSNPNLVRAGESLCDGYDGNCDGNVDEAFFPLPGTACNDGQLGACRGTGAYQCNTAQDDTVCVISSPGATPQQELCDNLDNDCDGLVDESFANPGTNPSYVQDDVVTVTVGGQAVRVFRHEASRPGATAASSGTGSDLRACSRPSVLPWARVTHEQARLACQKAGMTLCGDLEWTEACDGNLGSWAYPYHATTYAASTCNGAEAGVGAAVATGSRTLCDSEGWGIFDLSGNLREWTSKVVSYTTGGKVIYGVRGGSFSDLAGGLRCDAKNTGLVEDAFSANVGFRCCSRCGNGVVDQGEQCDDGNLVNGDGCSARCGKETCGDGVVQAGEACDCGTNPGALPGGCPDVNGGSHANCAANCTRPQERCSVLYPGDQDLGGDANDCADPDCVGTWCADVADNDGDGFSEADGDCNDNNASIHPAADEVCNNGVDDNCNGYIDNAEPDKDEDGALRCVGSAVYDCDDWNPDRTPGKPEICGDGIDNNCDGGVDVSCASACEIAAYERSYRGCDYYTSTTMNSLLSATFNSNFSLVAHNPNTSSTTVTVRKGATTLATRTLAANEVYRFALNFDTTLKNTTTSPVTVTGGAFRVTSTLPITLYQFNPFDYYYGGEYSYSNDASLVLPVHVLTGNYMVTTRPTFWDTSPGFFAIIGTGNSTTVQVTYNGHAYNGPNRLQVVNYNLNAGDVLQVPSRNCSSGSYAFCSSDYDFTGTRIQVTAGSPVAVIAGHNCLYLPPTYGFCDHIEEMLFPLETWGKNYVATYTAYATENQYRVVSSDDNNVVTFTPAVTTGVTLQRGQYVTFQTTQNFTVNCTKPCLVTQFILADDYFGALDSDPAMGILVPMEQFRRDYTFQVPSSMTRNYVTIVKPVAQAGKNAPTVYLDGVAIPETNFSAAIGTSYFGVARVNISTSPYSHTIESDQPFGIMVYGFASYTSYLYPGGLDLNLINAVN